MSRFSWGFPNLQVDHLFQNGPPEVERIDTQNDAIFEAGDTQKNPNHHSWYLRESPPKLGLYWIPAVYTNWKILEHTMEVYTDSLQGVHPWYIPIQQRLSSYINVSTMRKVKKGIKGQWKNNTLYIYIYLWSFGTTPLPVTITNRMTLFDDIFCRKSL